MSNNAKQSNRHKSRPGLGRIWNAFLYSLSGLRSAFLLETAFRQEVIVAIVLVAATFVLPVSGVQQALLVASVLMVLVVELLNSAVEAAVDRISIDDHELAKRAKDIGSAAVFMTLLSCLATWTFVLLELFGAG